MDEGTIDNSPCSIRPATCADLTAILRLEEECFSAPWTRKMFEAELTGNPFARLWCAWPIGSDPAFPPLVGYIGFWVVFEEFRLMTLAVAPSMRRRGTGRWLLEQALEKGREDGARRALLEVRASNATAIHLYEQLGFRRFAIRERYYTNPIEDAWMMGMEPIQVKLIQGEQPSAGLTASI